MPRQRWVLLTIVYLGFGSSFLAIEIVVRDMPPLTAAGLRFLIAGVLLSMLIGARRGWRKLRVARRDAPFLLLAGVLLFLIGNGGVMLGQSHGTPSWLAALIVATIPVWVAILRLTWGPRPSRMTLAGTAIGLLGTALVITESSGAGGSRLVMAIPVLAGAVSWAVGTYLAARRGAARDPMLTSSQQLSVGGALLLCAAMAFERDDWAGIHLTWQSGAALAWLILASSIAAMVAFYRIVALSSVSSASTYAFVNPVVATLLSGLIVGAWPDAVSAAAMLIVVGGVAVVVLGDRGIHVSEGGSHNGT
jgi:drug/metabolite transporter (DMT)-like permease